MKGPIAWFAQHRVAANLLMALIVFTGVVMMTNVRQEVFPEFSLDRVTVTVPYPGAAPEEIEEAVSIRIEEAIYGIEGVKRITSRSSEGVGVVSAELFTDADVREVLDDVKARVDAIDTFPEDAEEPVVEELTNRRQVVSVVLYGRADEKTLKKLGQRVRDELAALPDISIVELANVRPYEISIEVAEDVLRRHGLTFDEVATAVGRSSIDLPGGSIRTQQGEILLRTEGQAETAEEFARIPLRTRSDGTRLLVGDVARVVDGFAETDQSTRFDGQPAVIVQVFRVGEQDALAISHTVAEYVEIVGAALPEGVSIATWQDESSILKSRRDLLLENAAIGIVLVFVMLTLFLRFKLAFWVMVGIPVSFLGVFALLPSLGGSINLISLFGFILVLGIVVDDAIIVGENIHKRQRIEGKGVAAAVHGAQEVARPVVFAVLTSIAAFAPLLFAPGLLGKFTRLIPVVVITALAFSLVESLLILPAHLSHEDRKGPRDHNRFVSGWRSFQDRIARGLELLIEWTYRPAIRRALEWRYLTASVAVGILLLAVGIVGAGWIKFVFLPDVEADAVAVTVRMPQGTAVEVTDGVVGRIEAAATSVRREIESESTDGPVFRHLLASIGDQPVQRIQQQNAGVLDVGQSAGHLGELAIELTPSESRSVPAIQVLNRWREAVGEIPGAELSFSSSLFSPGDAINVQLTGDDMPRLVAAADRLKEQLRGYPGVFDVADSFEKGKDEIEIDITPAAELLQLTRGDLARQVRQAFYGEEVQRIQRGKDEVKVMVRYTEAERRARGSLDEMRVRTPAGDEVPFPTVATTSASRGFATISRVDRRRAVNVTANVDDTKGNANEVMADLERTILPEITGGATGIAWSFEGQGREQAESLAGLARGLLIAVVCIYALMAIPFKSYVQPLIVISAIPFGLVGALLGHLMLQIDLTILSMFGLVALSGVVVNDSLVLVDFINRSREAGAESLEAVREAGVRRFRPVLLTSLTTFAGLTPLLLEKSVQAQFLIPMAVSLAFGVLFATGISLVLVPCGYAIVDDLARLLGRGASPRGAAEPEKEGTAA